MNNQAMSCVKQRSHGRCSMTPSAAAGRWSRQRCCCGIHGAEACQTCSLSPLSHQACSLGLCPTMTRRSGWSPIFSSASPAGCCCVSCCPAGGAAAAAPPPPSCLRRLAARGGVTAVTATDCSGNPLAARTAAAFSGGAWQRKASNMAASREAFTRVWSFCRCQWASDQPESGPRLAPCGGGRAAEQPQPLASKPSWLPYMVCVPLHP